MSEAESRLPEWRENPGAVSEAIFYVSSPESGSSPDGKYRYGSRPRDYSDAPDPTARGVYVKGDYVPDFDYASFSAEVFTEFRTVLSNADLSEYDDGTILLRFIAFNRTSEWKLEGEDAVLELLESTPLETVAFGTDDDTSSDSTDSPDPSVSDDETDQMVTELRAIKQLHDDITADLIESHSPRDSDEYVTAFGSLDEAIAAADSAE